MGKTNVARRGQGDVWPCGHDAERFFESPVGHRVTHQIARRRTSAPSSLRRLSVRKTAAALRLAVCLRHDYLKPRGDDISESRYALYRKQHLRARQTRRNLVLCPEPYFPADGPASRRRGLGRDETQ